MIDVSELHKIRRLEGFQILKLWNVRSGTPGSPMGEKWSFLRLCLFKLIRRIRGSEFELDWPITRPNIWNFFFQIKKKKRKNRKKPNI